MPLALMLALNALAAKRGYRPVEQILHEKAVAALPWWLKGDR